MFVNEMLTSGYIPCSVSKLITTSTGENITIDIRLSRGVPTSGLVHLPDRDSRSGPSLPERLTSPSAYREQEQENATLTDTSTKHKRTREDETTEFDREKSPDNDQNSPRSKRMRIRAVDARDENDVDMPDSESAETSLGSGEDFLINL